MGERRWKKAPDEEVLALDRTSNATTAFLSGFVAEDSEASDSKRPDGVSTFRVLQMPLISAAAQLRRARLENVFQCREVGLHLTLDGPLDERLGELEKAARLTFHDDVDTRSCALGLVGLVDVELHRS